MDKNQNGMPILPDMGGCEMAPMLCEGVQLAMVYAPYQNFEDLYAVDKGFYTGTIFAQLDLPCTACTCCRMNKQGGMRYE